MTKLSFRGTRFRRVGEVLVIAACAGTAGLLVGAQPLVALSAALLLGYSTALAVTKAPTGTTMHILGLAAVFTVSWNAVRPTPWMTVGDVLLVATLIAAVAVSLLERRVLFTPPVWLVGGALLIACGAALAEAFGPEIVTATVVGPDEPEPGSNFNMTGRLVAAMVGVPVVLALAGNTERRFNRLLGAWIAGVTLNSLAAVAGASGILDLSQIVGVYQGDFRVRGGLSRHAGLTTHPTLLGFSAAVLIPLVIVQIYRRKRLVYGGVAGLLVAGIVVSGSRGAGLGAVVGAIFLLLLARNLRLQGVVIMAVAFAAVVALAEPLGLTYFVDRLFGATADAETSSLGHAAIAQDTWRRVEAHPLTGYGFQHVRGAHTIALSMLEAGGILALGGLLFYAIGLVHTGQRMRQRLTGDSALIINALLAGVAVWLVMASVQSKVFDRLIYLPAGMMLALWWLTRKREAMHVEALTRDPDRLRVASEPPALPPAARATFSGAGTR